MDSSINGAKIRGYQFEKYTCGWISVSLLISKYADHWVKILNGKKNENMLTEWDSQHGTGCQGKCDGNFGSINYAGIPKSL